MGAGDRPRAIVEKRIPPPPPPPPHRTDRRQRRSPIGGLRVTS